MFGIGTSELLIILVIILLLFGSSKLPELGKGLGQGLRSFRDAMKGPPEGQLPPASTSEPEASAADKKPVEQVTK